MFWTVFITVAVIFLLYVIFKRVNYVPGYKRAGNIGEEIAENIIKSIMKDGDRLFNNVCIEVDGKEAEFDSIVVNKNGVFIIEVKNYKGRLYGSEEDSEWSKYKTTGAGNTYEKSVKNPTGQVKRQVYLLSRFLKYNGADAWINGYVYFIEHNSPVKSEYVLGNRYDIDKAIHTVSKNGLSKEKIKSICKLLGE